MSRFKKGSIYMLPTSYQAEKPGHLGWIEYGECIVALEDFDGDPHSEDAPIMFLDIELYKKLLFKDSETLKKKVRQIRDLLNKERDPKKLAEIEKILRA